MFSEQWVYSETAWNKSMLLCLLYDLCATSKYLPHSGTWWGVCVNFFSTAYHTLSLHSQLASECSLTPGYGTWTPECMVAQPSRMVNDFTLRHQVDKERGECSLPGWITCAASMAETTGTASSSLWGKGRRKWLIKRGRRVQLTRLNHRCSINGWNHQCSI